VTSPIPGLGILRHVLPKTLSEFGSVVLLCGCNHLQNIGAEGSLRAFGFQTHGETVVRKTGGDRIFLVSLAGDGGL